MFRYLAGRTLATIVMALLSTLVVFVIASVVPGDPVLAQLGDMAASNPDIVREYRAKWGLPADYPMVAPNYAEQRRELAKKIGLGRQPTVRRGRGKRKKLSIAT